MRSQQNEERAALAESRRQHNVDRRELAKSHDQRDQFLAKLAELDSQQHADRAEIVELRSYLRPDKADLAASQSRGQNTINGAQFQKALDTFNKATSQLRESLNEHGAADSKPSVFTIDSPPQPEHQPSRWRVNSQMVMLVIFMMRKFPFA